MVFPLGRRASESDARWNPSARRHRRRTGADTGRTCPSIRRRVVDSPSQSSVPDRATRAGSLPGPAAHRSRPRLGMLLYTRAPFVLGRHAHARCVITVRLIICCSTRPRLLSIDACTRPATPFGPAARRSAQPMALVWGDRVARVWSLPRRHGSCRPHRTVHRVAANPASPRTRAKSALARAAAERGRACASSRTSSRNEFLAPGSVIAVAVARS